MLDACGEANKALLSQITEQKVLLGYLRESNQGLVKQVEAARQESDAWYRSPTLFLVVGFVTGAYIGIKAASH